MTGLVIAALGVVVAGAVLVWMATKRNDPGRGASARPAERRVEADRPAGPAAETMDPDDLAGDHRPPGPGRAG